MIKLSHRAVEAAAISTARSITKHFGIKAGARKMVAAFPVPRGGVAAAYMVAQHCPIHLVDVADDADCFIDDLIDSGRTRDAYAEKFPGNPFFALFDKQRLPRFADGPHDHQLSVVLQDDWLVFPWEGSEEKSADDIPTRLLQFIGEDPTRGGLLETPKRFLKAWREYSSGYRADVGQLLKVFEDGAEKCDELVLVKDIPVYSHCEHHLAPFFGVAHLGYIPNGKIVGLSKLSRLVDAFAKRLQVQERLTNQIADAMTEHLAPLGVGVVIECRHLCMESRGIQRQGSTTITSAMRGALRDEPSARAEFLSLVKGGKP